MTKHKFLIFLIIIFSSCSDKKYNIDKIAIEFSAIDIATQNGLNTQKKSFEIFTIALDTLNQNRNALIDTSQFRSLIDNSISETSSSIDLIQKTECEDKEIGLKDKALIYENLSKQVQENEFKECIALLSTTNADRYFKLAHKLKTSIEKLTLAENDYNNAVEQMISKYGIQRVKMK